MARGAIGQLRDGATEGIHVDREPRHHIQPPLELLHSRLQCGHTEVCSGRSSQHCTVDSTELVSNCQYNPLNGIDVRFRCGGNTGASTRAAKPAYSAQ